jgi:hypothetical protein
MSYWLAHDHDFSNDLTDKIKRGTIKSVKDVLCDPDLEAASRQDAQELAEFWLTVDPDRSSENPSHRGLRLQTLFEWALTDRWNTRALNKQFRRFEVNRNAATYLSTPSKRIGTVIRELSVD